MEMTEPLYDSPPLSVEELGDIGFLQNLPSILASHVLDPQPGDTILDMCASPGTPTQTGLYHCTGGSIVYISPDCPSTPRWLNLQRSSSGCPAV